MLLFAVFLAAAVVLRLLPEIYQDTLAQGVRGTVLRPVLALQRGTAERQARFADPIRLRAERDSLAAYLVGQSTLASENRRLRDLLGLGERLNLQFVPAEVMRAGGKLAHGEFLLTAGESQGVKTGDPVVTASGLVGTVRVVDDEIAIGVDWTNPRFGASAMTVSGETFGLVESAGDLFKEPMLILTGTPFHTDLEEGALLVTSGHGVYPRGIPIGTIVRPLKQTGQWQKSYLVRPLVSPAEMSHVLVLGNVRSDDGVSRDLAATWGIQPQPDVRADTAAPVPVAQTPATTSVQTGAAQAARPAQPAAAEPEPAPQGNPTPPARRQRGPDLLGEPVSRPPRDQIRNPEE